MPGPFIDVDTWVRASDEEFERLLMRTDFGGFEADRDLPPLRARLQRLQDTRGVTDLHRQVSERVLATGARLVETQRYSGKQRSFALSPSGRYLAIANDRTLFPSDFQGSEVRIWELATGRVVAVHGFAGGAGGWREPACLQWSPSGQWLGLIFNQVSIGVQRPFSSERLSYIVDVTRRWGSPDPRYVKRPEDVANTGHLPAWCWSPDEKSLFVSTPGPDGRLGCIVTLGEEAVLNEDSRNVRWCPAPPVPPEHRPSPDTWVQWSPDGSRIQGSRDSPGGDWDDETFSYLGTGGTSSMDAHTGAVHFKQAGVKPPMAFSPDGKQLVHDAERLELVDGYSGQLRASLREQLPEDEPDADGFVWSPDGRRLAVLIHGMPDSWVYVFEEASLLCRMKVAVNKLGDRSHDTRSWAWSPDGAMGACLLENGGVELWAVGPSPRRIRKLTAVTGLHGLLWGSDDVLVGVGPLAIAFWNTATGTLREQASFELEAGRVPPPSSWCPWPERPGQFLPTERGWAFTHLDPDGTVFCPPALRESLGRRLVFAVDGRYAWPWSWAVGTKYTRFEEGPRDSASTTKRPCAPIAPEQLHRAHPVFEQGQRLRRDTLAPYVGQKVLVHYSYSSVQTALAVLKEVTSKGVRLQPAKGAMPGDESGLPYSSIHWIGPAIPLEEPGIRGSP
ncbi:hypothetical protein [Myxococcus stipitatus]|uniref:WD40 repeat domain-containing protein n=1 Tax=Myxococcus stipitatus TaxID=83455 RepID=UPI0030D29BF4